jgi:hypothetical protein
MSRVTKLRRVLKHMVTGDIPGITETPEPTPEVKQGPKVEVSEPLKQEEPQELSKMYDENDPDCNRVLALSRSVEATRAIKRGRTPFRGSKKY